MLLTRTYSSTYNLNARQFQKYERVRETDV